MGDTALNLTEHEEEIASADSLDRRLDHIATEVAAHRRRIGFGAPDGLRGSPFCELRARVLCLM
ncbi:MAG: hypothetical protein M0026_00240 [Nocardiopsaceae bacterium]|nr:hypothetical protein [Nocardiopsaceae bacterium]